jgi:hypothetical protein
MSAFRFHSWSRRALENDIKPGNRYRRHLGGSLAAIATVLDLRPDLSGNAHVHFAIAVEGSSAGRSDDIGTRILALRSFADTYRERIL